MTVAQVVRGWPLVAAVTADDLEGLVKGLEEAEKRLYAAKERAVALCAELDHEGQLLDLEACRSTSRLLRDERAICGQAMRAITEAQERIARHVLPTTERNMQLLLPQLTAGRYHDVRLTAPESEDGQPGEMDYRIRVWDPMGGRYVAKNLFSGWDARPVFAGAAPCLCPCHPATGVGGRAGVHYPRRAAHGVRRRARPSTGRVAHHGDHR